MVKPLVVLAAFLAPALGLAVSCGSTQSVRDAYTTSSHVFLGEVREVSAGTAFGRDGVRLANVHVTQVFKGALAAGTSVGVTAEESVHFVSDGMVPAVGAQLLVYANGEAPFFLGVCSRTTTQVRSRELAKLRRLATAKSPE